VLLLHGFAASLHAWEPWVTRLGDRYRLVSIDLPGHGLTRAPADYEAAIERYVDDVEAFAAASTLPRFALVGSSMGGNVAWEYALAHPERVDALVLVDASGWPDARPGTDPVQPMRAILQNPVLRPVLRDLDGTRLFREGLQRAFADPTLVDETMVSRYVDLARAPGHREILLQLTLDRWARRHASDALLAAIRVPTLVLQGARDPIIPAEHARRFAAAIPGAELVVFAEVGHLPMEEQPDRSAAVVARFLARAPAVPPG
jgi:pimeloyl-ACP methyl ester carboxylesterase